MALKSARKDFQRHGATLLTITPQRIERVREHVEEAGIGHAILLDEGNAVAERYGLRFTVPRDLAELYLSWKIDLPFENGDDSWTLPLPASYVVDREGVVRWAFVDPDYTDRPEPSEIVAALEAL